MKFTPSTLFSWTGPIQGGWGRATIIAVVLGVNGCAQIAPDYREPGTQVEPPWNESTRSSGGSPSRGEVSVTGFSSGQDRSNGESFFVAQSAHASLNGSESLNTSIELQELLKTAWQQHPQVTAAKAEVRAATAEITRAGALMDPQLNLTQGLDNTSRIGLSLSQRVPLFGQRGLAAEQAEQQALAARARWQQAQAEVTRDVLSAYAEYAYVLEAQEIVAQQRELLQQMLDVSRLRYSSGAVGQGDLLRLESELDRLDNQQVSLQQMVPVSAVRLNAALGRSPQEPLPEIVFGEPFHLPTDTTQLARLLEQHNPQLQNLKYQQAAGRTERVLAGRSGWPDLMVGVEHMRDPAMGDETNIMLGISLPIWRGRYRAQQDQAEANLQAVTDRLANQQQQLYADLTMAVFNFQEAQRNHTLYAEVLVPRAEQTMHTNLTAYRSGGVAFADLIASQREWLGFQLNQKRALADSTRWQGELFFLLGTNTPMYTGEVVE